MHTMATLRMAWITRAVRRLVGPLRRMFRLAKGDEVGGFDADVRLARRLLHVPYGCDSSLSCCISRIGITQLKASSWLWCRGNRKRCDKTPKDPGKQYVTLPHRFVCRTSSLCRRMSFFCCRIPSLCPTISLLSSS